MWYAIEKARTACVHVCVRLSYVSVLFPRYRVTVALGSACIINTANASPWDEVLRGNFLLLCFRRNNNNYCYYTYLFLTMYISGLSQIARSSPTRPPRQI